MFQKLSQRASSKCWKIYSKLEPKIDIPDSQKFICDVIDEINNQNSNQSNKIKIFGHEINPQFQNDLFLNLELLSNQVNKILLKQINSELVTNSKFNIFQFFSEKKFIKIFSEKKFLPSCLYFGYSQ